MTRTINVTSTAAPASGKTISSTSYRLLAADGVTLISAANPPYVGVSDLALKLEQTVHQSDGQQAVITRDIPGRVTNLAATSAAAPVLTWTDVGGETSYEIHRGASGFTPDVAGHSTRVGMVAANGATFTDSTVVGNGATVFAYHVVAITPYGWTIGNEATCTPAAASNAAPNAPTLTPSSPTSTGITLSGAYSDPEGDAQAARQWQITTAADTGFATPITDTGADTVNKTSYVWTGGSAGQNYIARARDKDVGSGTFGAWSASVAFTTAAGGPTTVRSDNFNRADDGSSLGTPSDGGSAPIITGGAGYGISGNQAFTWAISESAVLYESGVADCTVSITFPTLAGQAPSLVFRGDASNNYWQMRPVGTQIWLDKVTAGVATNIAQSASGFHSMADGDVFSVVLSGNSIICKLNGVAITALSITNSGFATNTKHGFGYVSGSTAMRWDSFSVTVP